MSANVHFLPLGQGEYPKGEGVDKERGAVSNELLVEFIHPLCALRSSPCLRGIKRAMSCE